MPLEPEVLNRLSGK